MPPPEQLEQKVNEIKARYQPRLDALKAAGEAATKDMPSKEEMALGFSVTKMKHLDWYVKIPEFVVRQPCMEYMKFPWGGGMHVPSVCMREKDWRFHVPEVTMREQKWILGVPEVTMKEQHWSFDVPEVKVESSRKSISEAQEKGEAVGQQAKQVGEKMSMEIRAAVRAYLTDAREPLIEKFDVPLCAPRSLPHLTKRRPNWARSLPSWRQHERKQSRRSTAQINGEL
jgi:hypothetical protein